MGHFDLSQAAWLRWFDTSARVTTLNHLKPSREPHDARVDRLERHVLGAAPAVAFPREAAVEIFTSASLGSPGGWHAPLT